MRVTGYGFIKKIGLLDAATCTKQAYFNFLLIEVSQPAARCSSSRSLASF